MTFVPSTIRDVWTLTSSGEAVVSRAFFLDTTALEVSITPVSNSYQVYSDTINEFLPAKSFITMRSQGNSALVVVAQVSSVAVPRKVMMSSTSVLKLVYPVNIVSGSTTGWTPNSLFEVTISPSLTLAGLNDTNLQLPLINNQWCGWWRWWWRRTNQR